MPSEPDALRLIPSTPDVSDRFGPTPRQPDCEPWCQRQLPGRKINLKVPPGRLGLLIGIERQSGVGVGYTAYQQATVVTPRQGYPLGVLVLVTEDAVRLERLIMVEPEYAPISGVFHA